MFAHLKLHQDSRFLVDLDPPGEAKELFMSPALAIANGLLSSPALKAIELST